MDNSAFLWQPAPTLAKTTSYDPASPINALTKVDGVAQAHDTRGNRLGAAGRTWRYDTRNMLVGANAPGMAATYGYYPEGGRAWKQVNGVTTLYLELDGIEWGAYEPNGNLKERTIRASGNGGAVVAIHSPSAGLIRLLPNRQGSVIGWLRPDGKLGGAYTYDAYGNSPQAGAAGPSFRYAGMRFDVETGLYHTPNRAYDPQDGRWMQLDPIGIKDGLNRYAYVKNSPLMGVDPTGQIGLIGAGIGAGLELGIQLMTSPEARSGYLNAIAALAGGDLKGAANAAGANAARVLIAAGAGAVGQIGATRLASLAASTGRLTNTVQAAEIVTSSINVTGNAVIGAVTGAANQFASNELTGDTGSVGLAALGGAGGGALGAMITGSARGSAQLLSDATGNFIGTTSGKVAAPGASQGIPEVVSEIIGGTVGGTYGETLESLGDDKKPKTWK